MDATTRWETEALRAGDGARTRPPKPTGMSRSGTSQSSEAWVTLKEAETATGIPVNTLRKWARKTDLPSYLESDGDISLRMVDLDAVKARAKELGREIRPMTTSQQSSADEDQPSAESSQSSAPAGATATAEPRKLEGQTIPPKAIPPKTETQQPTADEPAVAPETMIVPVDAWNKMLSQLGNLHEAGQQLADARERAGKAETEVAFLRERLGEIRAEQRSDTARQVTEPPRSPPSGEVAERIEFAEDTDQSRVEGEPASEASQGASTTYWRYLTTGWQERRRRRSRD